MTGYESKRAAAQDKLTQPAAPEIWMFQHDETGRVTCILNDGINTPELFLEMNPRYALIGLPNSLKRPWVDVQDEEIKRLWIQYRAALPRYLCFAKALLAKTKEENT